MSVPTYDKMFNPLLKAMKTLGGSATVSEIEEETAINLKLSEKDLSEIHRGNRTKFSYRLAWTRNYLKRFGLLENSARAVWSLTKVGIETTDVDPDVVVSTVKKLDSNNSVNNQDTSVEKIDDINSWQDEIIEKLKAISPQAFERLCQRVLREAGFTEVKVTGRSGDGGIDGRGIFRLAGFISFQVIFQCKRYQGSVGSREIREFKGTMSGRADKGLFITTGTYTSAAREEASRDGSVPIDLIDGIEMAQKMKELSLGVVTEQQETVSIDSNWFDNLQ